MCPSAGAGDGAVTGNGLRLRVCRIACTEAIVSVFLFDAAFATEYLPFALILNNTHQSNLLSSIGILYLIVIKERAPIFRLNKTMNYIAIEMLIGDKAKYIGIIIRITLVALIMTQLPGIFVGILMHTHSFVTDAALPNIWGTNSQVKYTDVIQDGWKEETP
jgi:hypothetical protein